MSLAPSVFNSTELVRFLVARVDDEDDALRKLARRIRTDHASSGDGPSVDDLRKGVIAKRQVIGHVQQLLVLRDQPNEKAVRDLATQILRSMAMPYGDHLTYREEWRVTTR